MPLERGVLRLVGTLAGCVLGPVLVALVGDSRWPMMTLESLIIVRAD